MPIDFWKALGYDGWMDCFERVDEEDLSAMRSAIERLRERAHWQRVGVAHEGHALERVEHAGVRRRDVERDEHALEGGAEQRADDPAHGQHERRGRRAGGSCLLRRGRGL